MNTVGGKRRVQKLVVEQIVDADGPEVQVKWKGSSVSYLLGNACAFDNQGSYQESVALGRVPPNMTGAAFMHPAQCLPQPMRSRTTKAAYNFPGQNLAHHGCAT